MDSTDVEVYGSRKEGVAYNYAGQRAGRPHLATWAEAGLTVAADLLAGNDDVRPRAAGHAAPSDQRDPREVTAGLGESGAVPRLRADAGYFTADLARAAVTEGCDFAIAAKRNTAMWRAYASIEEGAWVDALGMPGAQVAAVDYAPGGWPGDTYTIVRRVRVDAEAISADPRSRRRRTIDPASSRWRWKAPRPTPTRSRSSSPTSPPTTRSRRVRRSARSRRGFGGAPTSRTGSAKPNSAPHSASSPPGHAAVNTVWMWAALLAGNFSVLLQALTGIDAGGRAHAARLRHDLLCIPARLVRHGRRLTLRLPPASELLPTVLTRIRELDTAA